MLRTSNTYVFWLLLCMILINNKRQTGKTESDSPIICKLPTFVLHVRYMTTQVPAPKLTYLPRCRYGRVRQE